ncbi:MAG: PAC2 family protein [Actinomycetota bacterium]
MSSSDSTPTSYSLHESYAKMPRLSAPLLVVMLQGWIDASAAAHSAMQRLIKETGATPLLSFDADEFLDFRARRPTMELREGINTRLDWPSIDMMLGRDINDKEVLLLTGHEPDSKWNRFAAVVTDLAVQLRVRKMIGLGAYPFAAPHTRAVNLSCTSPSSDVISSLPYVRSSVDVPAGIEAVLEHVFTARGIPSVGIWAQVPHYATSMPYPPATVALLGAVCDTGGVSLDVSSVRAEAVAHRERLDGLVAANPEHAQLLSQLESAYDVAHERDEQAASIPSGDELAAQFEAYLRDQRRD